MIIGKRGTVEDGIFWVFRIMMIMIVVFLIVFFINSVLAKHLDSKDLELYLVEARVINSPSCLALEKSIDIYGDDSTDASRVYPGVVDLEKYDEKYLNSSCLKDIEKPNMGVKILLNGSEPVYINQEYYEDIEPLTFSMKYYKVKKSFVVKTVDDDFNETTRTLEVVVVAKRT